MTEQHTTEAGGATRQTLIARLAVGLIQGLLLYGLHRARTTHAWPATDPGMFGHLVITVLFTPLVLHAGLGRMRMVPLIVWTVVAAGVCACFGGYDLVRDPGTDRLDPHPQVWFAAAAFLYIAHHLIEGSDADRRLIARHSTYFDAAWKRGVQLGLSLAFVGAFWLLLNLGAALFKVIGLDFLQKLIRHEWFFIPVSTLLFAAAVQLTDVQVALIRGVRTVALTLLAWLMPVMALIGTGFLVALPFTGLAPLWKTGHSTSLLLGAIAALIVLINAAYQDGEGDSPKVLRLTGRLTAILLTPLTVIAAYGLLLRVGQHGLTPDRIVAMACTLVAACYALGYLIGAVKPGPWLKPVERTNVVAAWLILAFLLALFTPILDPARLSVADQVKRLEQGKIAPDKFDYRFLRFDSVRFGRDALKRLAAKTTGPNAAAIAAQAQAALKAESKYELTPEARSPAQASDITVHPAGKSLPDAFLKQDWSSAQSGCLHGAGKCDAFFADVDRDGAPELLLSEGPEVVVFKPDAAGRWSVIGTMQMWSCGNPRLGDGNFRVVAPRFDDIEVDGARFSITPKDACPAKPQPKRAK